MSARQRYGPEAGVADDAPMTRQGPGRMPALVVGQATSVGQVRPTNEDSILCERTDDPIVARRGLFCAVADGMGGHAAGDVASSIAVERAHAAYYGAPTESADLALRSAIAEANTAVYAAGSGATGRDHMGSTLTAAVLFGDQMVVGHVGDTRCYVIDDGTIRQLTRDHSWVADAVDAGEITAAEARVHPRRNIITRALGLGSEVDVDVYVASLFAGSVIVICSDGLHGSVQDDEIRRYVASRPPQQAADELVALANERGGIDNISVVVIQVGGSDEATTRARVVPAAQAPLPSRARDGNGPEQGKPTPVPTPVPTPNEPPTAGEAPSGHGHLGGEALARVPVPARRVGEAPEVPAQRPAKEGNAAVVLALLLALVLLGAAVGLFLVRALGIA